MEDLPEDLSLIANSLQTLRKRVEKVTAHGLSWDIAVQLLTLQALTEVSSHLATLNKALSKDGSSESNASSGHPGSPTGDSPKPRGRPKGSTRS